MYGDDKAVYGNDEVCLMMRLCMGDNEAVYVMMRLFVVMIRCVW